MLRSCWPTAVSPLTTSASTGECGGSPRSSSRLRGRAAMLPVTSGSPTRRSSQSSGPRGISEEPAKPDIRQAAIPLPVLRASPTRDDLAAGRHRECRQSRSVIGLWRGPAQVSAVYGWLRSSALLRPGPLIAGCSARSNETLPNALCRNGKVRLNAQFGNRPGIGRSCLLLAVPHQGCAQGFHGRSSGRCAGAGCGARGWGPHVSMSQPLSPGPPGHQQLQGRPRPTLIARSPARPASVQLTGRRCGARSPPVTARPAQHLTAVRGGVESGRGW